MKTRYKEVPIESAERIAKEFDKQEIIILAVDREFNKVHITTYGVNPQYCDNAKVTGEFLAEIFQLKKPEKYFDLIEKAKEMKKSG